MTIRQRELTIKLLVIGFLTITFIIGMTWYKDIVIRKEATRAMNILSYEIANYRTTVGNLPPQTFIDRIIESRGIVRAGNIEYRARWIDIDSSAETILAYSRLHHKHMFAKPGSVILFLEDIDEMERLIDIQQKIKTNKNTLKENPSEALTIETQKLQDRYEELIAAGKDGKCEWLPLTVFDRLFEKQQKKVEAELLIKQQQQ